MRTIKGDIGAIRRFTAEVLFRRRGMDQKKVLMVFRWGE
jgi:hypothetical protein